MKITAKRIRRKIKSFLPFNRVVDFVICGTQKGGTSALDAYLRDHPDICMADLKEVHYFDNERLFATDKPNYAKYHASFSPRKSHKILGEATPIYMYWNNVPQRIQAYNPQMKLIVLLRNPIERAYSHWNMEHSKNVDPLSFWDALNSETERCRKAHPLQHRTFSYVDRGFYLQQLQNVWSCFEKDQVLVLKSEELKQSPNKTLNHICEFLNVSSFEIAETKTVNSRPYGVSMTEKERGFLRSVFRSEIEGLEKALNWDCQDWLA